MEKLKFNPSNKKYYSEEFIKGFECGVERQFNADMKENTAEWIIENNGGTTMWYECSKCGEAGDIWDKFCKHCGRKMTNAVAE